MLHSMTGFSTAPTPKKIPAPSILIPAKEHTVFTTRWVAGDGTCSTSDQHKLPARLEKTWRFIRCWDGDLTTPCEEDVIVPAPKHKGCVHCSGRPRGHQMHRNTFPNQMNSAVDIFFERAFQKCSRTNMTLKRRDKRRRPVSQAKHVDFVKLVLLPKG